MSEPMVALLTCPQAVREDEPWWMASWANPKRRMEWIHRYFFAASTWEAAQANIEAWTRKPPCPPPAHARMRPHRLILRELPEYPLGFWLISWQERSTPWPCLAGASGPAQMFRLLRRLTEDEWAEGQFDPREVFLPL